MQFRGRLIVVRIIAALWVGFETRGVLGWAWFPTAFAAIAAYICIHLAWSLLIERPFLRSIIHGMEGGIPTVMDRVAQDYRNERRP